MKKILLISIFILAGFVNAEDKKLLGLKITIGPENYSDIYPAIWFCPEDGSISGLIEKSEKPPNPKFKIWIEPQDPEINGIPGNKDKNKGSFILIGNGKNVYNQATKNVTGKTKKSLNGTDLNTKLPVFVYQDQDKIWAFIILTVDRKAKTMSFMWRELKN